MSRPKIHIDRAELERALVAADGFIMRAARVLGVHRSTAHRRTVELGLADEAKRLRASAPLKRQAKYRPNATPAERLRWLDGISTASMSRQERGRIACARYYWRQRIANH